VNFGGLKPLSSGEEAAAPLARSAAPCGSFWWTSAGIQLAGVEDAPSGAQPLAAALDAEKFKEVAGTIAGDDTVLVITPRARRAPLFRNEWRTAPMNDPQRVP